MYLVEALQLFCNVNQLTGFCMVKILMQEISEQTIVP